jgi:hypothetical protein
MGLLAAGDGEGGGIEEPDLHEHRGLIPVDVLVGDLAILESHHHDGRDPHPPAGRRDPGEHERDLAVVRELEDEFVDHALGGYRPRDRSQVRVIRRLADELGRVEPPDRRAAAGAGQRRHVPDVRLLDHRAHRRVDVLVDELARHVLVEYGSQILGAHDPSDLVVVE